MVLAKMVFRLFGNYQLLWKARVLQQCAGRSPAVFPFRVLDSFLLVLGGAFWMYNHPPDEMLLCTHVDDILLSATTVSLARRFYAHCSLSHDCRFLIAGTFVGIDILRDRYARKMYLSQAVLIDCLLEQEFAGIMLRENLTSNDL